MKVALTLKGVDFPKTHDLDYLTTLADQNSVAVTAELASLGGLTPWAAEFRYDDAPLDALEVDLSSSGARCPVVRSGPAAPVASLW